MATKLRNGDDRRRDLAATSSSIDSDLVARRAYERYQQRGGEHGRDQQDWFEAERELLAAQHEQE